jgi:uncharacterized membrane protein YadS
MSVALATIFVLNAVALYLFPALGHLLQLSQHQFAVWAALAIHDTSSVVGAAALGRRWRQDAAAVSRTALPWFILAFVAAALLRSLAPAAVPAFDRIAQGARTLLALTLFLIGLGLTRATLASVGLRPKLKGVLLWGALGGLTLLAVTRWVS